MDSLDDFVDADGTSTGFSAAPPALAGPFSPPEPRDERLDASRESVPSRDSRVGALVGQIRVKHLFVRVIRGNSFEREREF